MVNYQSRVQGLKISPTHFDSFFSNFSDSLATFLNKQLWHAGYNASMFIHEEDDSGGDGVFVCPIPWTLFVEMSFYVTYIQDIYVR